MLGVAIRAGARASLRGGRHAMRYFKRAKPIKHMIKKRQRIRDRRRKRPAKKNVSTQTAKRPRTAPEPSRIHMDRESFYSFRIDNLRDNEMAITVPNDRNCHLLAFPPWNGEGGTRSRGGTQIFLSSIVLNDSFFNLQQRPMCVHWALVQNKNFEKSEGPVPDPDLRNDFFAARSVDDLSSSGFVNKAAGDNWNETNCTANLSTDRFYVLMHKRFILDGQYPQNNLFRHGLKEGKYFRSFKRKFTINKVIEFHNRTRGHPIHEWKVLCWCTFLSSADHQTDLADRIQWTHRCTITYKEDW